MSPDERSFAISDRLSLLVKPSSEGLVMQLEFRLLESGTGKEAFLATEMTDFGKVYSNLLIKAYSIGLKLDSAEMMCLRDAIQEALRFYFA